MFDFNDDEKKLAYPAILIVAIIVILMIVIIWIPKKVNVIEANINRTPSNFDYVELNQKKYENMLKRLLRIPFFDELYEKIDDDWISNGNFKEKDEVKDWLISNSILSSKEINIEDIEVYASESLYIFKYIIDNNGEKVSILVNEYTPSKYTISFEKNNFNSLSNKEYNYETDKVVYNIKLAYVGSNIVQYDVSITNSSTDTYEWILNDYNDVKLELNDGTGILCSNITTFGSNSVFLGPEGKISFKINFNVNLDKLSLVKAINFGNIYKNGAKSQVVVLMNGGV